MNHTVKLAVRFARAIVQLDTCINFRFEKERYTPYTVLSGQWYCPWNISIGEIMFFQFYIDNKLMHIGYPSSAEIVQKDGRTLLNFSSNGYSSALVTNQCPDGLITGINLTGLIQKSGITMPNIAYQQNTPTANYVNYYDGTSLWDAIVGYSLRVGGKYYPYLSGYNLIRIEPVDTQYIHELTTADLISRGYKTDYSRMISRIAMKGIEGTPSEYVVNNPLSTQRNIIKCREINFDREWIMDPESGVKHKINYSMREVISDVFSFRGFTPLDLLDRLAVTDLKFEGEVDRLVITGNANQNVVTTIWCYHDGYCT